MIALPDQFLALPSGRTHHRVDGPDTGAPVVFVPGATLPLFVWDGLADSVAASGFRAIRYDLLGRGSSAAPRVVYDTALHRRQLAELLDALGSSGPVHLVSLASGALVAADFADKFPSRVASVTYLAPDGFGVRLSAGVRLMQRRPFGELLTGVIGKRLLLSRLPAYSDDRAVVDALHSKFLPYVGVPGFRRAVLSSIRTMPIHDAADLYRRVDDRGTRTLVLWGREDRVTPLPASSRLAAAMPNAEVRIFDGVGHLPHAERPREVSRALVDFLSTIKPRR
ncbi:alpha/beta fold hydrolase [Allokutzneria sp. NRRL B-24872]|uniref:alpha/beta fold hydrolase n=1 Tax=Allokutzneria sp. NRRL B-24872 TaxID=1137961 RepID=UPI000A3AB46F|nr:alpha/beta fold hydrolase [Allokutzneria sp. NRRL B-24872]